MILIGLTAKPCGSRSWSSRVLAKLACTGTKHAESTREGALTRNKRKPWFIPSRVNYDRVAYTNEDGTAEQRNAETVQLAGPGYAAKARAAA